MRLKRDASSVCVVADANIFEAKILFYCSEKMWKLLILIKENKKSIKMGDFESKMTLNHSSLMDKQEEKKETKI
jgi:hypothetical protein